MLANLGRRNACGVVAGAASKIVLATISLFTMFYVLPETPITTCIAGPAVALASRTSLPHGGNFTVNLAAYVASYAMLLILLGKYFLSRPALYVNGQSATRFTDSIVAFASLYLLDFFLSPDPISSWWALLAFVGFFAAVLFLNVSDARRLFPFVIACLSVQAVYGIASYITGTNQLITPGFGARTEGTFDSPQTLYPLCLIAFSLSFGLLMGSANAIQRVFLFSQCLVGLSAPILTFMRGGILGFFAAATYGISVATKYFVFRRLSSIAAYTLVAVLTLTAVLFRTHGAFPGTLLDRSTHGRFAIWQVAALAIEARPWLGSGVGSYSSGQTHYMTSNLSSYDPRNADPKSLLLNIFADLGLAGMVAFVLIAWRYVMLARTFAPFGSHRCIGYVTGMNMALLGLAVAGLTDTPIFQKSEAPSTFVLAATLGALCVLVRDSNVDFPSSVASVRTCCIPKSMWGNPRSQP